MAKRIEGEHAGYALSSQPPEGGDYSFLQTLRKLAELPPSDPNRIDPTLPLVRRQRHLRLVQKNEPTSK